MSEVSADSGAGHIAERLVEMITDVLRHVPERHGVGLAVVSTLGRLQRVGPMRMTLLAGAEGVTVPSMTRLVQRMEQHHWVTRMRDPDDGRACIVEITDTGRLVLGERWRALDSRLIGMVSALPADEQNELAAALRVAVPIVRRMVGDGAPAMSATPRPGERV